MHRTLAVVVVLALGLWLAGASYTSAQEPTPAAQEPTPTATGTQDPLSQEGESGGTDWGDLLVRVITALGVAIGTIVTVAFGAYKWYFQELKESVADLKQGFREERSDIWTMWRTLHLDRIAALKDALGSELTPPRRDELSLAFRTAQDEYLDLLQMATEQPAKVYPFLETEPGYPGLLGTRLPEQAKVEKASDIGGITPSQASDTRSVLRELERVEPRSDNPKDHLLRGNAFYAVGDFDRAAEQYERALKLDATDDVTLLNHALALGLATRYKESLAAFDQGLKLSAVEKVERVVVRRSANEEALTRGIDQLDSIIGRGVTLAHLGEYKEAVKAYDRALNLRPYDALVTSKRAVALGGAKKVAEAEQAFQTALLFQPGSPEIAYDRATFYAITKEPDKATTFLAEAVRVDPRYRNRAGRDNFFDNIRLDLRFREFMRLADIGEPEFETDPVERRFSQELKGKYAIAEALLQREVEAAKSQAGIEPAGQVSEAQELPETLRRNLSEILEHLGEIRPGIEEPAPDGARTDAQIAEEQLSLGNSYFAAAEYEKALEAYNRALELHPDHAPTLMNRSATFGHLGRYEDALADMTRALELQPNDADTLMNRGNAFAGLERYEDALADYSRALELRPGHADTLMNRGNALDSLERHEEALVDYNRAAELRPDHADTIMNRGVALHHLARHEAALADYDRALELRPNSAIYLFNRAAHYSDQNKLGESFEDLSRAIELDAKYREKARTDSDFDNLRNDPEYGPRFQALVAGPDPPPHAEDASGLTRRALSPPPLG